MYWLLSIILLLIIAFVAVILFFFNLAFVRNNKNSSYSNSESLKNYMDTIKNGIDYIKSLDLINCKIKSFDNLILFGRYFDNKSSKTIILFHGYRSDAFFDFSCAVKFYVELGVNILIVDQRAHGDSEGKLITFGIKERYDVKSWIEFVNEKFGVEEIYLSGISMGATTVLLSADRNLPANVKGIIADCGFTSPAEIIKTVAEKSFHIRGWGAIAIINLVCKMVGGFSVYEASTVDALEKSDIPVFFIHGAADNFVPCYMSEQAYDAAKGEKHICIVDNADHGLSFLLDGDNITEKITDFICS